MRSAYMLNIKFNTTRVKKNGIGRTSAWYVYMCALVKLQSRKHGSVAIFTAAALQVTDCLILLTEHITVSLIGVLMIHKN